jgi:hypothetical protein
MLSRTRISIWFFIGLSLLVNGGLILAAGLYELPNPPQHPVILFNLHASIWWGGLLFLLGIFYSYHFTPTRTGDKQPSKPLAPGGDTHAQC